MKILHVSPYFPPHIGGIEAVAQKLNEAIAANGNTVVLLTSTIGQKGNKTEKKGNLIIKKLPAIEIGHIPVAISFPIVFWQSLKEAEIVHVHAGVAFFPEITVALAKIAKKPVILTFHCDTEPSGIFGFFLPFYNNIVLKWAIKNCTKISCLTNDQAELVVSKYHIEKEKITVIPNGIDENVLRIKHNKKFSKTINLLFVGRFAKQKNIPRLIEAVEILSKKNTVFLRLVGAGEEEDVIRKIVTEKGLGQKVIFLGFLGKSVNDFKKWEHIFNESDIFVSSSDYEGLPLSLMEAMAVGIPIVATKVRGVKEFADGCAVLAEPNAQSIAEAIEKTAKNSKLRKKISAAAFEKIKKFGWNTIAMEFEKIYQEAKNAQ